MNKHVKVGLYVLLGVSTAGSGCRESKAAKIQRLEAKLQLLGAQVQGLGIEGINPRSAEGKRQLDEKEQELSRLSKEIRDISTELFNLRLN